VAIVTVIRAVRHDVFVFTYERKQYCIIRTCRIFHLPLWLSASCHLHSTSNWTG